MLNALRDTITPRGYTEHPNPCNIGVPPGVVFAISKMLCLPLTTTLLQTCIYILRMAPTKYKGFYTRLGPRGKSRSLQGLLESTKKNWVAKLISLESQQK